MQLQQVQQVEDHSNRAGIESASSGMPAVGPASGMPAAPGPASAGAAASTWASSAKTAPAAQMAESNVQPPALGPAVQQQQKLEVLELRNRVATLERTCCAQEAQMAAMQMQLWHLMALKQGSAELEDASDSPWHDCGEKLTSDS